MNGFIPINNIDVVIFVGEFAVHFGDSVCFGHNVTVVWCYKKEIAMTSEINYARKSFFINSKTMGAELPNDVVFQIA